MKLLTLNTHGLQETRYEDKLHAFVRGVLYHRPDVIALQEVSQTAAAPPAVLPERVGFVPVQGSAVPLRQDNHALRVARLLLEAGVRCSWTWLPVKLGYERYDEGEAMVILTGRITATEAVTVSASDSYRNWRTRRILGVRTDARSDRFYSVHMSRWDDDADPFSAQWRRLSAHLAPHDDSAPVWLMGDFNVPADVRREGYALIAASGWHDTHALAAEKHGDVTVPGAIDGWREPYCPRERLRGIRIDHIWCSRCVPVLSSRVVFAGRNEPVVSDHYGLLIETGG